MAKCLWANDSCEGKIKKSNIFSRGAIEGLTISICEKHLAEYECIQFLYRSGYDTDDILKMSKAEQARLVKDFMSKGENYEE